MSKAFHEWFNSDANPMRSASRLAQEYTADALKAAFEAGERAERALWNAPRDTREIENIFK